MDYQAILEALDARTLEAFQVWGETFSKGLREELDRREAEHVASLTKRLAERDKLIDDQDELIQALDTARVNQLERIEVLERSLAEAREAIVADAQKQVREALARLPVPTYKGVFDRGADYQAGDMVTHKGSVWHCNAATSGEAPGPGEAWTLAVKCGRDGKDLTKEAAE